MKQAMPRWRTLTSDSEPVVAAGATPSKHSPGAVTVPPRWLLAALTAVGGFTAGGALVVLMSLLLSTSPGPDLGAVGEPLEPVDVADSVAVVDTLPTDVATTAQALVVDVAGAVVQPGLHRLHAGDRVGDAIAAAGGFGPRVDLAAASQSLNLAEPLEDGVKVLVPELGIDDHGQRQDSDPRIDLNRASQEQLESLPGIGPVTAGKIIEARAGARFSAVGEVRSRGLVGQSVFDDIKELVRVSS